MVRNTDSIWDDDPNFGLPKRPFRILEQTVDRCTRLFHDVLLPSEWDDFVEKTVRETTEFISRTDNNACWNAANQACGAFCASEFFSSSPHLAGQLLERLTERLIAMKMLDEVGAKSLMTDIQELLLAEVASM